MTEGYYDDKDSGDLSDEAVLAWQVATSTFANMWGSYAVVWALYNGGVNVTTAWYYMIQVSPVLVLLSSASIVSVLAVDEENMDAWSAMMFMQVVSGASLIMLRGSALQYIELVDTEFDTMAIE